MIAGELDGSGNLSTKMKGGFWSFYNIEPAQIPPTIPGPKITIH
jgi:hypothetical protein